MTLSHASNAPVSRWLGERGMGEQIAHQFGKVEAPIEVNDSWHELG